MVEARLTTTDVMDRLNLGKVDGVIRLIRSGLLRAHNVSTGKRPTWRISEEDLAAFLESRRAVPAPAPVKRQRRAKLEGVTRYF